MSSLLAPPTESTPAALTERYRPLTIAAFAGLDKPKKIAASLAANPRPSAWGFTGPSGTGKTSLAFALANEIAGEVHHITSQNCNLETIERVCRTCHYVPALGYRWHVVIVDEADRMTEAAQIALLSKLDHTAFPPQTIFIFTANSTERLEARFLSRLRIVAFSSYGLAEEATALLARIWQSEAPNAPAPNFARIVKEANNNIREALMRLDIELMLA